MNPIGVDSGIMITCASPIAVFSLVNENCSIIQQILNKQRDYKPLSSVISLFTLHLKIILHS